MENQVSIVEDIIRSYPELAEKLRRLKQSAGGKDPTERAALAELPPEEQRRYDAVTFAMRHTACTFPDGIKRLAVIKATYWNIPFSDTLKKVSAAAAQEYRQDFIQAVAQRLELNDCDGCVYWRRLFNSSNSVKACMYCYDTGGLRCHNGARCYSKRLEAAANHDVVSHPIKEVSA